MLLRVDYVIHNANYVDVKILYNLQQEVMLMFKNCIIFNLLCYHQNIIICNQKMYFNKSVWFSINNDTDIKTLHYSQQYVKSQPKVCTITTIKIYCCKKFVLFATTIIIVLLLYVSFLQQKLYYWKK